MDIFTSHTNLWKCGFVKFSCKKKQEMHFFFEKSCKKIWKKQNVHRIFAPDLKNDVTVTSGMRTRCE